MILDIVTYPAASLKEKCVPVTEITDEIRQLAADMLETMYEAPGVGLAAPQVGRNICMLVMDPAAQDEEKQPRVVINPELTLSEETVLSRQEGCLSVPLNYRADVQRAERVHLRYMDLDGKIVEEDLEGFPAIVIQHEADHLDGTLFIDGHDVNTIPIRTVRKYAAYVPQDNFLFGETIESNIAFATDGGNHDDVETAAKLSDDGKIVAVGKHDELYAGCPEYRTMVDLQKLDDAEENEGQVGHNA